jgi:AraC family ethanolamine operon transcriptional activator
MRDPDSPRWVTRLTVDRFDPGVLADIFQYAAIDVSLLPGPPFHCVRWRVPVHPGSLEICEVSTPVYARGRLQDDWLAIGCTLAVTGAGQLNGYDITPASINVFGEGVQFDYRTAPGFIASLLWIRRAELERAALERLGRRLELPRSRLISLAPGKASRSLGEQILAWRDRFPPSGQALDEQFAAGAEATPQGRDLLDAYLTALANGMADRERIRERRMHLRLRLIEQIDHYARAHRQEPLKLAELAAMTGRSERSLQYLFREIFGLTPQAWFKIMRLNGAYRDLNDPAAAHAAIAQVAGRWGFDHLGRFARDYRRLFGETPSATRSLRRA